MLGVSENRTWRRLYGREEEVTDDREGCIKCVINFKGKRIPLQAWTGSEGSRWFRLPDFKTIDT